MAAERITLDEIAAGALEERGLMIQDAGFGPDGTLRVQLVPRELASCGHPTAAQRYRDGRRWCEACRRLGMGR